MPGAGGYGKFTPPKAWDGKSADANGLLLPDYCLVRLFDVTVEPGKIYQYRIQVRMGNPNLGREDVAAKSYAEQKELLSPWYVIEQKAAVPPELQFYAVDQAKLDAEQPKPAPDAKDKPPPPLYSGDRSYSKDSQTVLQIHRWIDYLHSAVNRNDLPLGEWVIAERVIATRGEYVGRPTKVEAPYWRKMQDRWLLAADPTPKGADKPTKAGGVTVPLAAEPEPVLVDFNSADLTYKRMRPGVGDAPPTPAEEVKDKAPVEVLLFDNGKLRSHDSFSDSLDTERKERVEALRKWVDSIKNAKGGKDANDPFSGKGP
jgi:hypothetical protein